MSVFIGIDTGEKGAIAIIEEMPTPTLDGLMTSVNVFDFEDPTGLYQLKMHSTNNNRPIKAVIEKVQAMPRQGVHSMFKFGKNAGRWEGRLEALDIPFDLVTPQKWRKRCLDSSEVLYKYVTEKVKDKKGLIAKRKKKVIDHKAMSLERARRLFPELAAEKLNLKKHDGRAEALLLAHYCRLEYGQRTRVVR